MLQAWRPEKKRATSSALRITGSSCRWARRECDRPSRRARGYPPRPKQQFADARITPAPDPAKTASKPATQAGPFAPPGGIRAGGRPDLPAVECRLEEDQRPNGGQTAVTSRGNARVVTLSSTQSAPHTKTRASQRSSPAPSRLRPISLIRSGSPEDPGCPSRPHNERSHGRGIESPCSPSTGNKIF